MNGRLLLLLLISCGLALVGIAVRSGAMLALTAPFVAYVLIGVFGHDGRLRLKAGRTTTESNIHAGDAVEMRITLHNLGGEIVNLRVEDSLPTQARLAGGATKQVLAMRAGATAELTYAFVAPRGVHAWQHISVAAADPLGLLETRLEIPAPGQVVVHPTAVGAPKFKFRPRRTLHSAGPMPVGLPGSSTDFLGVREYRSGDALRRINWRMSARHPGRLFTNEHERQEAVDYGLILDSRQTSDADLDRAVTGCAALADTMLRDGNRVALLVFGRKISACFPGYGKHQLNSVLRTLSGAERSAYIALDLLDYFPRRLFSNRAVLVFFSSALPSDGPTYGRLRAAGYEILLVSPEPSKAALPTGKESWSQATGRRAARVERRTTLLSLSKLGIRVVDWRVDQPLDAALDSLAPHAVHRTNLAA
jgi:uncharacterized protein (DUF58 family)